jgi:hypothetical protein
LGESVRANRKLFGWVVALIALIVLVFVAVPYGVRQFVRSRLSPAQVAFLEKAYKPPQVPASWAEVTPYSDSLRRGLAAVSAEWQKRESKNTTSPIAGAAAVAPVGGWRNRAAINRVFYALAEAATRTEWDWNAARALVRDDTAFTDALLAFGSDPDYDLGVCCDPLGAGPEFSCSSLLTGVKLALMGARIEVRDGDTSRGLATALATLRLARHHAACRLMGQMTAILTVRNTLPAIDEIATTCSDTPCIRTALLEMEKLETELVPRLDDLQIAEVIGTLRSLKRNGYPVDLDLRKPLNYLIDQQLRTITDYPGWVLSRAQPDDPHRAEYERAAAEVKTHNPDALMLGLIRYGGTLGTATRELMLSTVTADLSGYATRHQVAAAQYRLACVALAQRLAELDRVTTPTAVADLVPAYLATEPMDPFTSAPFMHDARAGFYSVGPDGQNDRCAVAYNPTNGTLSAGDIVLRQCSEGRGAVSDP